MKRKNTEANLSDSGVTKKQSKKGKKPFYSLYLFNEEDNHFHIKQFTLKEECKKALEILNAEVQAFESLGYSLKTGDSLSYFMKGEEEQKDPAWGEYGVWVDEEDSEKFETLVAEDLDISVEEYRKLCDTLFQ